MGQAQHNAQQLIFGNLIALGSLTEDNTDVREAGQPTEEPIGAVILATHLFAISDSGGLVVSPDYAPEVADWLRGLADVIDAD